METVGGGTYQYLETQLKNKDQVIMKSLYANDLSKIVCLYKNNKHTFRDAEQKSCLYDTLIWEV